jgi:hypothetical protein
MWLMRLQRFVFSLIALFVLSGFALAQNPNYPGHLGVFVVEGNGGMQITGFIRDTPAADLASQGGLSRNDTILRLGGKPTRSLGELKAARNRIPEGQEGKMILRGRNGTYHVWISRSEAVAASIAPGGDKFSSVAPGSGNEGEDFRPKGGGEKQEEGDFRPKP